MPWVIYKFVYSLVQLRLIVVMDDDDRFQSDISQITCIAYTTKIPANLSGSPTQCARLGLCVSYAVLDGELRRRTPRSMGYPLKLGAVDLTGDYLPSLARISNIAKCRSLRDARHGVFSCQPSNFPTATQTFVATTISSYQAGCIVRALLAKSYEYKFGGDGDGRVESQALLSFSF